MKKKNIRFRFGQKIKDLRTRHRWTQAELAGRSGVSRSYVQKIEGKRPPDVTIDIIVKLARAFRLSCSEILRLSK